MSQSTKPKSPFFQFFAHFRSGRMIPPQGPSGGWLSLQLMTDFIVIVAEAWGVFLFLHFSTCFVEKTATGG
jgi:hypothetical protein